jgi:hypothetical protein
MRVLWTLLKVMVVLAIVLPLSIIVLGTGLVALAALLGLAIFVLKLAVAGVLLWGGFRLLARLVRGPKPPSQPREIPAPPPVDRHYEAALRELDRELGEPVR